MDGWGSTNRPSIANRFVQKGYEDGVKAGATAGFVEGYEVGVTYGLRTGQEVGFYYGCALAWQATLPKPLPTRTERALESLIEVIRQFPHDNPQHEQLTDLLELARSKFRLLCVHVKSSLKFAENGAGGSMSF